MRYPLLTANTPPQTKSLPLADASPAPPVDERSPTLHEEIDALRAHMSWLQESIAASDSIDERVKLGRAYQESGYCLARLLRTQHLLHSGEDTEWEKAINKVTTEILAEWGRI